VTCELCNWNVFPGFDDSFRLISTIDNGEKPLYIHKACLERAKWLTMPIGSKKKDKEERR